MSVDISGTNCDQCRRHGSMLLYGASTETAVRLISLDGKPGTATSTFTQLLSSGSHSDQPVVLCTAAGDRFVRDKDSCRDS